MRCFGGSQDAFCYLMPPNGICESNEGTLPSSDPNATTKKVSVAIDEYTADCDDRRGGRATRLTLSLLTVCTWSLLNGHLSTFREALNSEISQLPSGAVLGYWVTVCRAQLVPGEFSPRAAIVGIHCASWDDSGLAAVTPCFAYCENSSRLAAFAIA